MKKTFLIFFCFCTIGFPSLAHAQSPFGGYNIGTFIPSCELPEFWRLPNCPGGTGAYAPPNPPKYAYDYFIMMKGPLVPPTGWMAMPPTRTVLYPNNSLRPGSWALGSETPYPGVAGGWYMKGLIIPMYNGPPKCIPSRCNPYASAVGLINPETGSSAI